MRGGRSEEIRCDERHHRCVATAVPAQVDDDGVEVRQGREQRGGRFRRLLSEVRETRELQQCDVPRQTLQFAEAKVESFFLFPRPSAYLWRGCQWVIKHAQV